MLNLNNDNNNDNDNEMIFSNGHFKLALKVNQSLLGPMLKCLTELHKQTCLQTGTKTIMVSVADFPVHDRQKRYLYGI